MILLTCKTQRKLLNHDTTFHSLCTEVGGVANFPRVSTPTITRHPSPITTSLDGRFELECSADGAAAYDWYKDGKLYKTSRPYGKLVFDRALPSDAGTYYCEAIGSSAGKTKSQSAKVTVGTLIHV